MEEREDDLDALDAYIDEMFGQLLLAAGCWLLAAGCRWHHVLKGETRIHARIRM